MKLKAEKETNISVIIDNNKFISFDEGLLFQHINENEIYLYIRNEDKTKEVKIHITKK